MVVLNIETEDGQREAFRRMLTIRAFGTKMVDLFSDDELPRSIRLYVGEETIGVDACPALKPDNYITSTHRGYNHRIAKGLDPDLMVAELSGKTDGYYNGKSGSIHIADAGAGMFGAGGTVDAGPSLTTGTVLILHLKREDIVALVFFDGGVIVQGQVHEAVNLTVTQNLPAASLVENSRCGETAPIEKQYNVQNLSETAEVYNIPGFTVDGVDITAVYGAVKEAHRWAADNEGPTFIRAETHRYYGRFKDGQQSYRTKEDVAIQKDRGAIETFKRQFINARTATEVEFDEMEAEIGQQIRDAVGRMKDVTYPDLSEAYEDVFNATVLEVSDFFSGTRVDGGEDR